MRAAGRRSHALAAHARHVRDQFLGVDDWQAAYHRYARVQCGVTKTELNGAARAVIGHGEHRQDIAKPRIPPPA